MTPSRPRAQPKPQPPTSTCSSSAPASPASTSSTGPSKPGSPPCCSRPASGVGGTWYWNRYPGARFDSESYTYGYLFSRELFDEWEWPEHFAAQPETERYLNHVVDRFELRAHIRFGARVTSAEYDEASGTWRVTDRRRHRGPGPLRRRGDRRPLGAVPARRPRPRRLRGRVAPHRPVAGGAGRLRRQAGGGRRHRRRAACRSSPPSPTRWPRSPCTSARPTGARRSTTAPITAEEQAQLRAEFEQLREILNTSVARLPPPGPRPRRLRRPRRGAPGASTRRCGTARASPS